MKTVKNTVYLLGLVVLAMGLGSCDILQYHTMLTYHKNVEKGPFDVIVVPGLPYDTFKTNPILKARVNWAKELYEKGTTRYIIFSGSAVHSPYIESMIMKMMADSMGVPTRHTFIEDRAHSSTENVAYGVALARKMGFKKIAVATDPIQTLYLKQHLKKQHTDVAILPFSLKDIPHYLKLPETRLNHANAHVENYGPCESRNQNGTYNNCFVCSEYPACTD